jgi:hypothetical protein
MAADLSQMPSFSRGSAVLEYWLIHAEGLVVQPLGARVEHVVVAVSAGRADSLIVRSRLMHRRKTIPAAAIAAVEPSTGRLLLDSQEKTGAVRALRWTTAAAAVALRWMRATAAGVLAWLRPHVVVGGAAVASAMRLAAAWTVQGIQWLAPRVQRGLARLGQQAKRTAVLAADDARASLEAHRAHRARRDDAPRNVDLPRPRSRR